jgi:hypothetical protein
LDSSEGAQSLAQEGRGHQWTMTTIMAQFTGDGDSSMFRLTKA